MSPFPGSRSEFGALIVGTKPAEQLPADNCRYGVFRAPGAIHAQTTHQEPRQWQTSSASSKQVRKFCSSIGLQASCIVDSAHAPLPLKGVLSL